MGNIVLCDCEVKSAVSGQAGWKKDVGCKLGVPQDVRLRICCPENLRISPLKIDGLLQMMPISLKERNASLKFGRKTQRNRPTNRVPHIEHNYINSWRCREVVIEITGSDGTDLRIPWP